MPESIPAAEWVIRLAVAAALSGFIGFERETAQKAAGLRTHMLIGLGACLFTLVSGAGFEGGDPTRIAAQIVSGVGFLGAGAIFREGANVRGLTTAAGIWTVAAIGTTAGVGLLLGALAASLIAVLILSALPLLDRVIRARTSAARYSVLGVTLDDIESLPRVVGLARALDAGSGPVELRSVRGDRYEMLITISADRAATLVAAVSGVEGVLSATEINP